MSDAMDHSKPHDDAPEAFSIRAAERYTMAEAARIKGVSYHTVSRAVRQERLPAQRLGRMALISGDDLDAWQPMRAKAPLRFRGNEPNQAAAPVVFDDAMGSRLEFARQLSTLYEVIHAASTELSLERFGDLLARRFASVFGLPSVAVWVTHPRDESIVRIASFGPPMSRIPDHLPARSPSFLDSDSGWTARVSTRPTEDFVPDPHLSELGPQGPLLLVPLRARGRVIGAIAANRDGAPVHLSDEELELAQVLGNQAALAIDNLILRREERYRIAQHAAILDQVTDLVRACDVNGRLEIANRADQQFRTVAGVPAPTVGEDAMLNPAIVARTELDGSAVLPDEHPLARALRGEVIQDWEYLVTRLDGSTLRSRVSAQPLVLDGEVSGAVFIGRDVTREREQETLLEAQSVRLARVAGFASALESLAAAMSTCNDEDEAWSGAVQLIATHQMAGSLALSSDARGDLRLVTWSGGFDFSDFPVAQDPFSMPTAIQAISRGTAVTATNVEAGRLERAGMEATRAELLVAVPIVHADRIFGVIYLLFTRDPGLHQDDLALLTIGGHLIAAALARLRLQAG